MTGVSCLCWYMVSGVFSYFLLSPPRSSENGSANLREWEVYTR